MISGRENHIEGVNRGRSQTEWCLGVFLSCVRSVVEQYWADD
jgi:hypothetical protein